MRLVNYCFLPNEYGILQNLLNIRDDQEVILYVKKSNDLIILKVKKT